MPYYVSSHFTIYYLGPLWYGSCYITWIYYNFFETIRYVFGKTKQIKGEAERSLLHLHTQYHRKTPNLFQRIHNQQLEILLSVQLVSPATLLAAIGLIYSAFGQSARRRWFCKYISLVRTTLRFSTFETVLIESSFSHAMWLNKNKTRMVSLPEVQATYNQCPKVRHVCRNTTHF